MRRPSFCSDVRFGLSKLTSRLGKDVVAGVFLLTCNFTDALLLSLNSLRLAGKGLTEIGFFLNVPTVMRPCDGTSGLVRGNCRKAVFAFKGLFSEGHLSRFRFGTVGFFIAIFGREGKTGNLRAQTDFRQQNRTSRKPKTGVWSADLGFSPHFWNRPSEVCGKFRNPQAHRPFHEQKPQVDALTLSSVVGISRICRILPD